MLRRFFDVCVKIFSARGHLACLAVLAFQFGAQPFIVKRFILPGTLPSSIVIAGELVKLVAAVLMLFCSGSLRQAFSGWTVRDCLLAAGLPSCTYAIQNQCVVIAYQNLDAVTFNVVNQAKVLATAFFAFVICGRRQSKVQLVALVLVCAAGFLANWDNVSEKDARGGDGVDPQLGMVCIIAVCVLSGLGSGLSEYALQERKRHNLVLSIEFAILGSVVMLVNLCKNGDFSRQGGIFANWTWMTAVPVLTNSGGGILVGYLTKVTGALRKTLATIFGLVVTCVIQHLVSGGGISLPLFSAVLLVVAGTYLHATHPVAPLSVKKA
jgi:UDP-sugar transporter A1/2/3|eukprot:TRINITY_DN19705_c0_g1_i1.p1 TRINITY_DN19705_c0_g1~~TRINITY_DN19705_c0_g1_i1.p1  ORF type:complete len:324 (+),score=43.41 TRINITY_DN19705_c0_g1_i1:127-1098(+)